MSASALAGASGIVYVVLSIVVAAFIQGQPLPSTRSGEDRVAAFYAKHRTGFLIGNFLGVAALAPSLPFMAHLTQVIRRAEGPDGLAGLTFFGAGLLAHALGAACLATFQLIPLQQDPKLAKLASDLANLAFGLCFVLIAAFVGAAAWGALATGALPGWAAWTALAVAALSLVASLGTIATTGRLAAGGVVSVAAFLAYLLWTLAVSIALLRVPAA